MKFINKPVFVKRSSEGAPLFFLWRNFAFKVDCNLDIWKDTGRWWDGEKEKTFHRVVSSEQIFEIYTENGEDWYLYKVYD